MGRRERELIWSAPAERDLAAIWNYLPTEAGVRTADACIKTIETRCQSLVARPFLGGPRSELRPGLRSLLASPYIIFYRVNHAIQIVRVLHGRRDLAAALADDDS